VSERFLDPAVLARIDNLELLARTVVDGFISGLHQSPYLGLSTDFAEHRPYLPGDDIRRIDWRLWGRTDRLYVKEFEADTNANVVVLLDVSRSMAYGSGPVTKLDYAKFLAAALLYLSRRQRDRVGLVTFDQEVRELVPASARHLERCLHVLAREEARGPGALAPPLLQAGATLRRRSILILLSDLYETPESIVTAAGALRGRGSDVLVIQVLDPAERSFPFGEPAHFEDLETGDRIPVVPGDQAGRYRALMAEHLEAVSARLGEAGMDYELALTDQPLDYALFHYLSRRQAMARVR
jgi:uncharacterized protein (DUF58 family)